LAGRPPFLLRNALKMFAHTSVPERQVEHIVALKLDVCTFDLNMILRREVVINTPRQRIHSPPAVNLRTIGEESTRLADRVTTRSSGG
jgi:hypothetical protein